MAEGPDVMRVCSLRTQQRAKSRCQLSAVVLRVLVVAAGVRGVVVDVVETMTNVSSDHYRRQINGPSGAISPVGYPRVSAWGTIRHSRRV